METLPTVIKLSTAPLKYQTTSGLPASIYLGLYVSKKKSYTKCMSIFK